MTIDPKILENSNVLQEARAMREALQEGFPKHITLVLVDENDNPLRVIE